MTALFYVTFRLVQAGERKQLVCSLRVSTASEHSLCCGAKLCGAVLQIALFFIGPPLDKAVVQIFIAALVARFGKCDLHYRVHKSSRNAGAFAKHAVSAFVKPFAKYVGLGHRLKDKVYALL